jgi:hypothetical protein
MNNLISFKQRYTTLSSTTFIASGGIQIRPSRYFEHITNQIIRKLPASELPEEFKVEFRFPTQTIQFNMLNDDQMDLIVEIAKVWVAKIRTMVEAGGKTEYEQTISYPNVGFLDPEKAIVQIYIHYRIDREFNGERVTVNPIK